MNRLSVEYGAADSRGAIDFITRFLKFLHRDRSKVRGDATDIAVDPPHHGVSRIAQLCSVLGNGVHHRLQVRSGTGDHP